MPSRGTLGPAQFRYETERDVNGAEKSVPVDAETVVGSTPLVTEPIAVVAVLLTVLAVLFGLQRTAFGRVFKVIPLLVFAYFVPTALSNFGVIPLKSEAYTFIKVWLLPASILLLTLSVDIPGILRLGPKTLLLFFGATFSIMIGGPLAYLLLKGFLPEATAGDEAWRGLAALSGSWIGGGANYLAIGTEAEASDKLMGLMVIVDVAVANVWTAMLLFFSGRETMMDARLGADRNALDSLREKVEGYLAKVRRPTSLADLLLISALAIAGTVFVTWLVKTYLPESLSTSRGSAESGGLLSDLTWIIIVLTAIGVGLSFTPVRRLEGAGASDVGSLLLYLLVATIGAKGDFSGIGNALGLVSIGALWMFFHASFMLILRRITKAPIFLVAVCSQANVGGAASAPVVASAFHRSLAPVGTLLAVFGYVIGTTAGLVCMALLEWVHSIR